MSEISRRDMLKISGPYAIASLLGLSIMKPVANASEQEISQKLKIIVVGAHPDDPETGCGGTMALIAKDGHEVISAYFTRGEAGIPGKSYDEAAKIRTAEALKACKILKVKAKFLGQIDGNSEITKDRYQTIYNFFEEEKPDIIFNHWPIDTHRDHRICSVLVYDAWESLGKKSVLYYYEVMSGMQTQNFVPSNYVDILTSVEQKYEACCVHESQNKRDNYQSYEGKMAQFRGMEINTKYAEAFVRHIQSPKIFLI